MNKKQQREAEKAAAAESARIAAEREQAAKDASADNDTAPGKTDSKSDAKPAKTAKPVVAQTVTLADGTTKTLVAIPKPKRERKAKPAKACSCGCGGMTKGGRFIPGHDSRLHAWCRAVEKKLVALADIPEGERQAVEAHMNAAK